MTMSTPPITFEGVVPILRVRDLDAAVDYYTRILGFSQHWRAAEIASVARGRCDLFLAAGDQGNPGAWVWVGVSDAALLHQQYLAAGAKIRHPPTNYPWALEMQVEDLDGNVLRMGSDSLAGVPCGEWLDMHGVRWRPAGEGWERV